MPDDPKQIWQHQSARENLMTIESVHRKARELRTQARRHKLRALASPLIALFVYGFCAWQFPRAGYVRPLLAVAFAWSLAGLYFLNRGMSSPAGPGADLAAGLEFCRREIERRGKVLGRVLLWSFGPVLLSIAALILSLALAGDKDRSLLPNGLPFLILAAAWVVLYFILRVRELRRLHSDLEELNHVERNNSH